MPATIEKRGQKFGYGPHWGATRSLVLQLIYKPPDLLRHAPGAIGTGHSKVDGTPPKFLVRVIQKLDRGIASTQQQKGETHDLALPPRRICGKFWTCRTKSHRARTAGVSPSINSQDRAPLARGKGRIAGVLSAGSH